MRRISPPGYLSPGYLLIESPGKDLTASNSLQVIKDVAQALQNLPSVSRVDYYAAPSGQLMGLAAQVRGIGDELGQGALTHISELQTTSSVVQGLVVQYPGIVQSPNFQPIAASLTAISTLAKQLSTSNQATSAATIAQLQNATYSLAGYLKSLAGEFNLTANTPFTNSLMQTYFSTDRSTARINIALSTGPYEPETVNNLAHIRQVISNSLGTSSLKGSSYYIGGQSAIRTDIMNTSESDFGIVVGVAIAGVLIVIIILLRSLVAPLYMVATVLLNYGATLGITSWLFTHVSNQTGMIYMLPIFIFIILVALGADYNIFLVSRIREETNRRPLKEAISQAVASTGGVITSCGIILAGTFATLIVTPLQMVMQIGTAIVIGVIVDTFVVRALLVPSIATLVGRWSWWPSRLSRRVKTESTKM